MKKKSLLASLGASVAAQNEQARDKFDMADLTMAMKRASAPSAVPPVADVPLLPDPPDGTGAARRSDIAPVATRGGNRAMVTPAAQSLAELPIALVHDHPRNARHLYDPTRIDEMAASIARDGQMMPAIVMADPDKPGSYLLIEGRYRKRALQSLGRETILAIVVDPLPELEAYRLSLILNEERNEQTDLDNAISWKMLLDDGLFTSQDHIAEYL